MFTTKNEIAISLCEVGVGKAEANVLAQQAKPAVALIPHLVEDEAGVPIGATKIGGRPDLPADVSWAWREPYPAECMTDLRERIANPERGWRWATAEERVVFLEASKRSLFAAEHRFPLSFIAQINFAEMWAAGELDADMPREGIMYLFYDVEQQPWGFDPRENVGFSVIYHPSTQALVRQAIPEQLAEIERGRIFACETAGILSPLSHETRQCKFLGLSRNTVNTLSDWFTEWDEIPAHQVGGWPMTIQGDMQVQCALIGAGYHCGSSDVYKKQELASVRETATEWLLLAQIDSDDDEGGWMWGDSGRLYLWIKRDDLVGRRFERAQLILQCC